MIVANVYSPNPNNSDKMDFFNEIFDAILQFSENYMSDNVVNAGDFNLVLNHAEVKK